MTGRVLIRRYRSGGDDDAVIRRIVDAGAMSTVFSFFLSMATREFVSQAILMISAVLFIVVGFPLHYSLLSLPATFGSLYLTVWIGHRLKASRTHTDLKSIKKVYSDDPKCGFWVAELLNEESLAVKAPKETDYEIIREGDRGIRKSELKPKEGCGKIIGTVAICVKDDPDMRDPPGSVAWLRRMCVDKKHQQRGVGSALVDVVVDHCKQQNFSAIELITSEHHEKARSLYYKKGFELIGSYQRRFAGGLVGLNMFRLAKTLKEDRD